MTNREKVIRGLGMCSTVPSNRVHCHKCPYNNGISIGCMVELMKDALALLQKQEPRVMTVEEIKSIETWNRNTPPFLWVEDITGRDNRWSYWRLILESLNLPGTIGVQNYGSKWRVWNLRPTPEQMQGTPWEVNNNG